MKLDVLYIDNHLLVVNKPPGLLAQADETGDRDLLGLAKDFLKNEFQRPGNVYLGLVHRLDRPVSGIMVLARTSKAAARLSAQFRSNTPLKKYLAVVEGVCAGTGRCSDYLSKEGRQVRIVDAAHPRARHAELLWEAVAHEGGLSLVNITLKTGRPHQIRLQLSRRGLPIMGDLRYGARREFDGTHIALHCYLVGVDHPVQKRFMKWVARPPETWAGWFDDAVAHTLNTAH